MQQNMGYADRSARAVVGIILAGVVVSGQVTGAWAVVAGIVAAALLVTSIAGICPAYWPLKLSTRRAADQRRP